MSRLYDTPAVTVPHLREASSWTAAFSSPRSTGLSRATSATRARIAGDRRRNNGMRRSNSSSGAGTVRMIVELRQPPFELERTRKEALVFDPMVLA